MLAGRAPPRVDDRRRECPPSRPSSASKLDAERRRGRRRARAPPRRAPDRARAAQTAAGAQRVLGVQLRGVVRADRRGDAALRELARRTSAAAPFESEQHVRFVGRAQRGVEAGEAAADDDEVDRVLVHAHAHSGSFTTHEVENLERVYRVRNSQRKRTGRPTHVTLAVVLQVRDGRLQVLLWERALEPFAGAWSLPGGYLEPGRDARAARSGAISP